VHLACHPHPHHKDALSHKELRNLWETICSPPHTLTGPARAISEALTALGADFPDPYSIILGDVTADLRTTSLGHLRQIIYAHWDGILWDSFLQRKGWGTSADWTVLPLLRYIRNPRTPPRAKREVLRAVGGQRPGDCLGQPRGSKCTCGAEDSLWHRVAICPLAGTARAHAISRGVRLDTSGESPNPFLQASLRPHLPPKEWTIFREPELPLGTHSFFARDLPIYTDGSCRHPTNPWLAQATGAAVQLHDGKVTRILTIALPRGIPQTAAFGEHMGAWLARTNAPPGAVVHTDCNSVITLATKPELRATSPVGSPWLQENTVELRFLKTKAHRSREVAIREDGTDAHFVGNAAADVAANQAQELAPISPWDVPTLEARWTRDYKFWNFAGTLLGGWTPPHDRGGHPDRIKPPILGAKHTRPSGTGEQGDGDVRCVS
jgi:hypothetical protein